jgi:hypothetical protein
VCKDPDPPDDLMGMRPSCAGGPRCPAAALQAYSYVRGETRTQRLMETEQGGECFVDQTPRATRSREDRPGTPLAADPESPTAFTVVLERRTLPCEENANEPAKDEGRFTLTFLKRAGDIVPDETTARLLREQDWSPEGR